MPILEKITSTDEGLVGHINSISKVLLKGPPKLHVEGYDIEGKGTASRYFRELKMKAEESKTDFYEIKTGLSPNSRTFIMAYNVYEESEEES
ncbi:hypothetical protein CL622_06510 [archaeon]|nr:hypothetical protein [archaeon]|tara:strand:- start:66 stop:341 length:276 start_codon:yes stop_codon:yes gene_type:complete